MALIALALLMRVLVPGGWMPAAAADGFAITLCTGTGMETAWIDAEGGIHKDKPSGEAGADQHCAFAGMGMAMLGGDASAALAAPAPAQVELPARPLQAAIGQGLAAPPPPATGPPAHI
nr:DUF2946 family protein [Sphingomonas sp. G-3-2-10]